jgi:hypothetical protein
MRSVELHVGIMKWFIVLLLLVAVATSGCGQALYDGQEVSDILKQLAPASPEADRAQAIGRLQRLGTNAFPFLIAEMNSFKWHTPQETNKSVIDRAQRLRAAFDVFGTNLIPLTNVFVGNLNTNRNFVSAMDGLVAIGTRGVPYLLGALTHRESAVRLNAVAAILKLARTDSDSAMLAMPHLIPLLKDESVLVRSLATETLGLYCTNPSACMPALLEIVLGDSDEVVRSQAVKAVGRIQARVGRIDPNTRSVLEKVSRQDKSQVVRRSAERVLAQGNGN